MSKFSYTADWKPIETAPIKPFDADNWFMRHSPYLLLWAGHGVQIGSYGFTKKGKGRWESSAGIIAPTHWMPLPDGPSATYGE